MLAQHLELFQKRRGGIRPWGRETETVLLVNSSDVHPTDIAISSTGRNTTRISTVEPGGIFSARILTLLPILQIDLPLNKLWHLICLFEVESVASNTNGSSENEIASCWIGGIKKLSFGHQEKMFHILAALTATSSEACNFW